MYISDTFDNKISFRLLIGYILIIFFDTFRPLEGFGRLANYLQHHWKENYKLSFFAYIGPVCYYNKTPYFIAYCHDIYIYICKKQWPNLLSAHLA